jgi:hypothetical protein
MGHTITVRLDKELAGWLEAESKRTGIPQSRIIRDQLDRARAGRSSRSFMRLAGTIRGARDLSRRKGFTRG